MIDMDNATLITSIQVILPLFTVNYTCDLTVPIVN